MGGQNAVHIEPVESPRLSRSLATDTKQLFPDLTRVPEAQVVTGVDAMVDAREQQVVRKRGLECALKLGKHEVCYFNAAIDRRRLEAGRPSSDRRPYAP